MLLKEETATKDTPSGNVIDIETGLNVDRAQSWSVFRWRNLVWIAVAAVVIFGLYAWWFGGASRAGMKYVTAPATRSDLTVVVAANGSAHPITQVNISSELSGVIRKVFVDYNQVIRAGQVLAELDTERLFAAVESSRAKLELAKVRVAETAASLEEKRAEYERKKVLSNSNVSSPRELQFARYSYERAVAQHAATLADIEIAKVDLRINEINLTKATIRSPVDGIVLKRNTEPGQVVVVSLQAPVLFVIAEDLHHMEIRVDVNEADIGKISIGQKVTFSVSAFPGRKFAADVHDIRLGSEVVKGATVYKAILRIDNPDQLILPSMSARAEIAVQKIEDALLVPNAALSFSPSVLEQGIAGLWRRLLPSLRASRPLLKTEESDQQQTVWILRDGAPVALSVFVGATDGQRTEILGDNITVGQQVITGLKTDKH